jgi:hypothetical protein
MNKKYILPVKLVFLIFLILIIIGIILGGKIAGAEEGVGVKPVKVIDTPLTITDHQFWSVEYDYKISSTVTIPVGASLSIENGAIVDVVDMGSFYIDGGVLNIGAVKPLFSDGIDPVKVPPGDFLESINSASNSIINSSSSLSLADSVFNSPAYKVPNLLISKINISGDGYENLFYINNAGVVNARKLNIQGPIGVDLQRTIIGLYKKSKINLFETNINNIKVEGLNTFYANDSRIVLYRTNINGYSGNTFADVFKSSSVAILRTKINDANLNSGISVFSGSFLNFQKSLISAKPLQSSSYSSGTCIQGFSGTNINVVDSDIGPCFIGFNLSGTGNFKINKNNFSGNGDVVINFSSYTDFRNNWWGNADGPKPADLSSLSPDGNYTADEYAVAIRNQNAIEDYSSGVVSSPFSVVPFKEASTCCSGVLFIGGLQAGRLYKKGAFGIENQLWEPNRNKDVESLFLNSTGVSLNSSIYTRDIIAKTNFFGSLGSIDIYQSLIDYLSKEKNDGNISDFQTLAYDWRLLPSNILSSGIKTDSYVLNLKEKIKEMAKKAPSGKVIIVGHSYGGLLNKALIQDLEKEGEDSLIESVVLVSTPEYGTPQSILGILYGDNQDLLGGAILNKSTAMSLGKNMLSAHLLIPSKSYFTESDGIYNQKNIINFDGWAVSRLKLATNKIDSFPLMGDFLKNKKMVNSFVFDRAVAEHDLIDNYSANLSSKTYSIVPVGIPTLSGVSFVKPKCRGFFFCSPSSISEPDFNRKYSLMGDGVVIAHNLAKRTGSVFTVDIGKENEIKKKAPAYFREDPIAHKDIFRSSGVRDVLHAVLSKSKKESEMINSFGILNNPYVSYVSGSLSKPGPILGSFGDSSILAGISKIRDDAGDADFIQRFNNSKILIVEAYGPLLLKNKYQNIADLQNLPFEQLDLENRIVNYTNYSDKNRVGIVSVVQGGVTSGNNNSNFFDALGVSAYGGGVGVVQIVTKMDDKEMIYPNVSVTPSTNLDINYSTTTIYIDNNSDGTADKSINPIQINIGTSTGSTTDSLELSTSTDPIADLFIIARDRLKMATSTYLINKYIDKLDIAERKYQKSGTLQSQVLLKSFYSVLESNMNISSNLITKYNKEQSFYSFNNFLSTNRKVLSLNKRQQEIRNEILEYIEIHDVFTELMQGLGRGL